MDRICLFGEMGKIREPLPVKLFVGMLTSQNRLFEAVADTLAAAYGPVDLASGILPWDHSAYYRGEMGSGIMRKFLFFQRLIDPGSLSRIKHDTMSLEHTLRRPGDGEFSRRVNIDPGYVTEAKVILATTKDFSHRVYIGQSIFAEATLQYARNDRAFRPLDHTYPDFRSPQVLALFAAARERLRQDLKRSPKEKQARNHSDAI